MWSDNSTCNGLGSNRHFMCHTAMVPCSCTNPMTQWYNYVLLSSNSFPNYQRAPENTIYGFSHATNPVNPLYNVENDQEAGDEKMTTNETDSWFLPNPYNNQIDGSIDHSTCCSWTGGQDHDQFNYMQKDCGQSLREGLIEQQQGEILKFSQGIQKDYSTFGSLFNLQASLPPTGLGLIPEATTRTMNLAQESSLNPFSFLSLHTGDLLDERVGINSNSTRIYSLGTQQLNSRDDLKSSSGFPQMSRQERILRYLEKKKSRKYKKIIHSSRKIFARSRPRIRGRFVRRSETNVE